EITGAPVPTRSIEEVIQDAAQDFDAFYAERTPKPWTETGPILVAAVDGKGIPMIKPGGAQRRVRLTKGQKANRKRMAAVAAVFTRAPWIFVTPRQVVESLFDTDRITRAGDPPPFAPGAHAGWGQLDQRQSRRGRRGGRRDVTPRSARPQD